MNLYSHIQRLSFFIAILLVGVSNSLAQVSIAPTSVFLSEQEPFANLLVANGSDIAQEISISFRFGYATNDDGGNVVMAYDTTANESSLTDNVLAFPRNFVLQPGQRQTVRLNVTGVGNLDDGTYWTRVSVLAAPLSPPIESVESGAVGARININFEQVIPLFFRKGNVTTGVSVEDVSYETEGNTGRFRISVTRDGNSPFHGSITMRILDNNGSEVVTESSNVTAYFDITRVIDFDLTSLDPGEYSANFTIESVRRDISTADIIQIAPIQQTKSFTVE